MKYRITHTTRYAYSSPVSLCHNIGHLKPRDRPGQTCYASQLKVFPIPAVSREFRDYFGNRANYFAIQQSHKTLEVTTISEVDVAPPEPPGEAALGVLWEQVRERLCESDDAEDLEARLYVMASPYAAPADALREYAIPSFGPKRPLLEAVQDLMTRIHTDFTYDPHVTSVATPLEEVMQHRRGVCQDFAHLAIGCLRAVGLAARYVSGYLETLPPPGKPKLRGADASHAWFSVYVPEQGWFDYDPTNDKMPGEQHITTAFGRDFGDVTPLKGVLYGGGKHKVAVAVDVERLNP